MSDETVHNTASGRRPLVLSVMLTSLLWVVLGGASLFLWRQPQPATFEIQPPPATNTPQPTATATPTATPSPLLVDVAGAVRIPGVHSLSPGSRVQEAVAAAGGALEHADLRGISLARPLQDGEKLYVPLVGEDPPAPPAPGTAAVEDDGSANDTAAVDYPININTADAETLQALPGIGPKTAQAIADYRETNGPFPSVEDLVQVKGIGEGTLGKIRELVTTD